MAKQSSLLGFTCEQDVFTYAEVMARIENAIVVVSDIVNNKSRIFSGGFARALGLDGYHEENSIWEKLILSHLPEDELEAKAIAELQFFYYLKHRPKTKRNYYLLTKLRFTDQSGNVINVAHRMHYIYDKKDNSIKYAICIYSPLIFDFKGKSLIINSITGVREELSASSAAHLLTRRELQILSLIADGKKSTEIAKLLNLSIHTVSRHRQEILAKLRVKNSIEACRLAHSIGLL